MPSIREQFLSACRERGVRPTPTQVIDAERAVKRAVTEAERYGEPSPRVAWTALEAEVGRLAGRS